MPGSGFPANDAPYWKHVRLAPANPGAPTLTHTFTNLSEVLVVNFRVITSAVAGGRRAQAALVSSNNGLTSLGVEATGQGPGLNWDYVFQTWAPAQQINSGIALLLATMGGSAIALPGDTLTLSVLAAQAGDVISGVFITTREFLDNADNTNVR